MFDKLQCHGCGETNWSIQLQETPIVLHCNECDCDFTANDLQEHANEMLKAAKMLEKLPYFEQATVTSEVKVPSMVTPY